MPPETQATGFVEAVRKIIQTQRYGPRELALATLGFLLLGAAKLLPEPKDAPSFLEPIWPWLSWGLVALGLLLLGFSVWRIWKKVVAPLPEAQPKPAAIKGPAPFGPQDAELFARLGRNDDLDRLRSWILDDQKPLIALMGESGVGKTSLLRAGLAHHLQADKVPVLYWEAMPTDPEAKLLHAIQKGWGEATAPKRFEDLAAAVASGHKVVVIDQFEQLFPESHPRIFDLLRQVAMDDPPYRSTWVIAFRREYMPFWRDFELSLPEPVRHRLETLSLQRFSPKAAERVIAVLAVEGGIPIEQKVIEALVEGVAAEGKVSPADIGISLLVLSELAGGHSGETLSLDDFRASGGQVGLLTRYLEKLLEQLPETERREGLQALLSLIDLEKDQRLAEGRTLQELEASARPASPARFADTLRFLASGKARLLEELDEPSGQSLRYRLVHERLIPAIRRLTGVLLAEVDQAGLLLERSYRVWVRDRLRRYLLSGRDLRQVLRFGPQLAWGTDAADKRAYVQRSRRHSHLQRLGSALVLVLLVLLIPAIGFYVQRREHRSLLRTWGLPEDLLDRLAQIEKLTLPGGVTRVDWLSGARRLKELTIADGPLGNLEGLPESLQKLNVGGSRLPDLRGLPPALISLSLGPSRIENWEGLPSSLRSLDLYLSNVSTFKVDTLPQSLTSLRLVLPGRAGNPDFSKLRRLESLVLSSRSSYNFSLRGRLPASLRSLSLREIRLASFEEVPRSIKSFSYDELSLPSLDGLPVALDHLSLTLMPRDVGKIARFRSLRSLTLDFLGRDGVINLDVLPKSLVDLEIYCYSCWLSGLPEQLISVSIMPEDGVFISGGFPRRVRNLEVGTIFEATENEWKLALSSSQLFKEPDTPILIAKIDVPAELESLSIDRGYQLKELPLSLRKLSVGWSLERLTPPAGLLGLDLSDSETEELLVTPPRLRELNIRHTPVRKLPDSLEALVSLDIGLTRIQSLVGLPRNLRSLSLSPHQIDSLEGLPPTVTALHFF